MDENPLFPNTCGTKLITNMHQEMGVATNLDEKPQKSRSRPQDWRRCTPFRIKNGLGEIRKGVPLGRKVRKPGAEWHQSN
jgi:hypothetical protein